MVSALVVFPFICACSLFPHLQVNQSTNKASRRRRTTTPKHLGVESLLICRGESQTPGREGQKKKKKKDEKEKKNTGKKNERGQADGYLYTASKIMSLRVSTFLPGQLRHLPCSFRPNANSFSSLHFRVRDRIRVILQLFHTLMADSSPLPANASSHLILSVKVINLQLAIVFPND